MDREAKAARVRAREALAAEMAWEPPPIYRPHTWQDDADARITRCTCGEWTTLARASTCMHSGSRGAA